MYYTYACFAIGDNLCQVPVCCHLKLNFIFQKKKTYIYTYTIKEYKSERNVSQCKIISKSQFASNQ